MAARVCTEDNQEPDSLLRLVPRRPHLLPATAGPMGVPQPLHAVRGRLLDVLHDVWRRAARRLGEPWREEGGGRREEEEGREKKEERREERGGGRREKREGGVEREERRERRGRRVAGGGRQRPGTSRCSPSPLSLSSSAFSCCAPPALDSSFSPLLLLCCLASLSRLRALSSAQR